MLQKRVIPVLLYQHNGLVKTTKFKSPNYIGDPINAVRIYNEKEVDELIFLDIHASKQRRSPNFEYIKNITEECFMPLCYGGGISSLNDIEKILKIGVEKVAINSAAVNSPEFIFEAAKKFGSSTIVVSIDYKKTFWGTYVLCKNSGTKKTNIPPIDFAKKMEDMGAGELLIHSIDRDGTMKGYDVETITDISNKVNIPIIACGGAGNLKDMKVVSEASGITALAAGSMFVYQGELKGVLINYPPQEEIKKYLF